MSRWDLVVFSAPSEPREVMFSKCCTGRRGNLSIEWEQPQRTNGLVVAYWVKLTLNPWRVLSRQSADKLKADDVLPQQLDNAVSKITCIEYCRPSGNCDYVYDGYEKDEVDDDIHETFAIRAPTAYLCPTGDLVKNVSASVKSLFLEDLNPFTLYTVTVRFNLLYACGWCMTILSCL